MSQIPNKIKYYSGVTVNDTIKVKDFLIGMVDGGAYGPTSQTGFWMCISPPTNGYTIYGNKPTAGPVIYVAQNDSELVEFAKKIISPSITGATQALTQFSNSAITNTICVNIDYESITTDDLTLLLDAGYTPSYPRSGTTWYDVSYNGFKGTISGGTEFLPTNGGVLRFNGTNRYVSTQLVTSEKTGITLEAWLNCADTSQAGQMIFYNGSDANVNGYGFSINTEGTTNGNLYVLYGGISWFDSGYQLQSGQWYQVVLVISDGFFELFLDGVSIYSTSTVNPNTPTLYTEIARNDYPAARYFFGKIGSVKFWNRELTSDEIASNFNNQKNRYQ